MADCIRDIKIEGPPWKLGKLTGNEWYVPAVQVCPFCRSALGYSHTGAHCPRCDHLFSAVESWDAYQLLKKPCQICGQRRVASGDIVYCQGDPDPTHSGRSYLIGIPDAGLPCYDCGGPIDLLGSGSICRTCVLSSYLETRFDALAPRQVRGLTNAAWRVAVGFLSDAPIWGHAHVQSGRVVDRVPQLVSGRRVLPQQDYASESQFSVEYYAVAHSGPYQEGQQMIATPIGISGLGAVILYRIREAPSGLIYEAALPAGDVGAQDSEIRQTPRRLYRKRPYPDRVIGSRRVEKHVALAFERSARQWVVNEAGKGGRPKDTGNYTAEEWVREHANAVERLRRENIKPFDKQIAREMKMGERTYYDYQGKYGRQPR